MSNFGKSSQGTVINPAARLYSSVLLTFRQMKVKILEIQPS